MDDADHLALVEESIFAGRYRIVRRIGAGGMGAVYEVEHTVTRRYHALKVMLPERVADPDMRKRFQQEARVTAPVKSEFIVEISDAGVDPTTGMQFLVMELLDGENLAEVLEKRRRLPAIEVVEHVRQVALALGELHAIPIVHRDLKPENLFLTTCPDGSRCIKVLDFGIAKVVAESTAKTTLALGTREYMAPEQMDGGKDLGPRADLYALAHVAFVLLTGEAYWSREAAEGPGTLIRSVMEGAKASATSRARAAGVPLPDAFDAWFARATAVVPEDRFGSAAELFETLREALVAEVDAPAFEERAAGPANPVSAQSAELAPAPPRAPQAVVPVTRSPATSRRRVPLIAGALVLAASTVVALRLIKAQPPPPEHEVVPPADGGSCGVEYSGFAITCGQYAETDDLDAACAEEMGSGYQLADWNDVKAIPVADLPAWAGALGIQSWHAAMVSWNGQGFLQGTDRHYLLERHDGVTPSYFLVHDDVGDHFVNLGSWYEIHMPLLCKPDPPGPTPTSSTPYGD